MSESPFTVIEHVVPAQYVREFPHGACSDDAALQLVVKQYVPRNRPDPLPSGAITILAAHAIGVPKETYEPLWEDLLRANAAASPPVVIRSIWIADCAHLGYSGVLNAQLLHDDPSWHDHARDLLFMVNGFRHLMPRPIIGFGHSMSCAQLLQLAHIHPRLLQGLVLSEPVVMSGLPPGPNAAIFPSMRPDKWASRAEAEKLIQKVPYFRTWDQRSLQLYLQHGLRNIEDKGPAVTLTTPKAQEAWSYVRSMLLPLPAGDDAADRTERLLNPHLAGTPEAELAFYRPESQLGFENLPSVRPSILYIYGASSPLNTRKEREAKYKLTGTGKGGSGGARAGRVSEAVVEGTGHMGPVEKVGEWAGIMSSWLGKEATRWVEDEELIRNWDSKKSSRNEAGELVLSKSWMREVRGAVDVKRELGGTSKL